MNEPKIVNMNAKHCVAACTIRYADVLTSIFLEINSIKLFSALNARIVDKPLRDVENNRAIQVLCD